MRKGNMNVSLLLLACLSFGMVLTDEDGGFIIRTQKGRTARPPNPPPTTPNPNPSLSNNEDKCPPLTYGTKTGCKKCSTLRKICNKPPRVKIYDVKNGFCNKRHHKFDNCKKGICGYWNC